MIYVHACDFCQSTRAKRAAHAVLYRLPNITNTRAALLADVERPYLSELRTEMEARGCLPKRTATGNARGHVERFYDAAQTTGGAPIGATPAADAELAAAYFGLDGYSVRTWSPTATQSIGACYPGMRRAA